MFRNYDCNLITGMFQRIERMRKAAFTSVCVFGSDDNNTISVCLCRLFMSLQVHHCLSVSGD